MKRPVLVIASILKPVDDIRMYEKLAQSLGQTKKYEINIIGFSSKKQSEFSNIYFHPIFTFKRLSLKRLLAQVSYLRLLITLRPDLIIVSTHELLSASMIYKLFTKVKVVYDVRENYYLNLLKLDTYPLIIKTLLAHWVRTKEKLTAPFVEHYLLAEKCYAHQLSFVDKRNTIIENKASDQSNSSRYNQKTKDNIDIIFTGTIAESTGIFNCIETIKDLHKYDSKIRLKVVGYCAQNTILKKLKKEIESCPYISLKGGSELVPHAVIIDAIKSADFGFIYYPPNQANDECIPTKVYEYVALSTPYITGMNNSYDHITSKYSSGIFIDFNNPNYEKLYQDIITYKGMKNISKFEVLWQNESIKLNHIINHILL